MRKPPPPLKRTHGLSTATALADHLSQLAKACGMHFANDFPFWRFQRADEFTTIVTVRYAMKCPDMRFCELAVRWHRTEKHMGAPLQVDLDSGALDTWVYELWDLLEGYKG
jgi:hypothetical protein